ncbi:MAG: sigma-70 family RNA polymerase sigma factor [Balneolaceae bacterium]|nr:sigma-70 family RNA polymerase sigma factor [Balneolaceae bacterium]
MLTKEKFEALYDQYFDDIAAFLYSYASDKAQLKDWIHDVFLKIWDARDQINFDHPSFKSYLLTTARNHALKQLQKEKSYDDWLERNLKKLTQIQPPHEPVINPPDISEAYQHALSKIPSRACEAYLLSREEGLTYKEIAQEMEVSEKTVEAHLSKALRILRSELVE